MCGGNGAPRRENNGSANSASGPIHSEWLARYSEKVCTIVSPLDGLAKLAAYCVESITQYHLRRLDFVHLASPEHATAGSNPGLSGNH